MFEFVINKVVMRENLSLSRWVAQFIALLGSIEYLMQITHVSIFVDSSTLL